MEKQNTIIFISANRSENSTLEGKEFPPSEIIDTVDEIYSENGEDQKGRNRVIRYKPGEKSIFLDEQNGQYDKNGKIVKYGSIIIANGFLAIDAREVLLLEYLRACNGNASNKNRMPGKTILFKEKDDKQEADDYLKEEKADRALLNMIDNLEPDELEAYAMILGDLGADKKKTSELRRDLIVYAKSEPKKFKDGIKDVNFARKVHVIKAFKDGFITYDKKTNVIGWEDGSEIVRCPIGKDPADHLVELSFQPGFETVYASIEKRKGPEEIKVTSNTKGETDEELVKMAMEAGIFERNGIWYTLKIGEEIQNIGRGVNEIKSKIELDDELKELIRKRTYELVEQ